MKKIKQTVMNVGVFLILSLTINIFTFFNSTNNDYLLLTKLSEINKELDVIEKMVSIRNQLEDSIIIQLLDIQQNETYFSFYDKDEINQSKKRTLQYKVIVSNELVQLYEIKRKLDNFNISNYPNIPPVRTEDFYRISSNFGWRNHPVHNRPIFHNGIDIAVPINTNIYSTINGKVVNVTYSRYGYGNRVVISNNSGYEVLYAHLSNYIFVRVGDYVEKGDLIARSGNSGTTTGAHLHYEIRKNGKIQNPLLYFQTYLIAMNNEN